MTCARSRYPPKDLHYRYLPSEPCSCAICLQYCRRPGWWTVGEACQAIEAGYARRMMLEISPEHTVGVLSPAFKGCEGFFGLQEYSTNGCTFLENDLCQLFGSGVQPLECRFCHHTRSGLGQKCHADLEIDWDSEAGHSLVIYWLKLMELWDMRHLCRIKWLE